MDVILGGSVAVGPKGRRLIIVLAEGTRCLVQCLAAGCRAAGTCCLVHYLAAGCRAAGTRCLVHYLAAGNLAAGTPRLVHYLAAGTPRLVHYRFYEPIVCEAYSTRSNPQTLVKNLWGRNFSLYVGWEGGAGWRC